MVTKVLLGLLIDPIIGLFGALDSVRILLIRISRHPQRDQTLTTEGGEKIDFLL